MTPEERLLSKMAAMAGLIEEGLTVEEAASLVTSIDFWAEKCGMLKVYAQETQETPGS